MDDGAERSGPLSGLRVVEMGRFVAAPYASRLLGDLGADVVKVESTVGDPFRTFVQRRPGGLSSSFTALNRNKRSLTVDLKSSSGRRVVVDCLRKADVFIENSRPGTMARLGLGYDDVHEENPQLIYCSISGFGETGPSVDRPGYDTIGQAVSGLASQLLDPQSPQVMGPNLSDSITGITAAFAVLAALHERALTGMGQRVTLNLVGSTLAFLGTEAQRYLDTGIVPNHLTRPAGSLAFVFRCADQQLLAIHLSSPPKFWNGLLDVIDRKDLAEDSRFTTHLARQEHYLDLRDELTPLFSRSSVRHWLTVLSAAGVPCAVVNDMSEVFRDEQVRALGILRSFDGAESEDATTVGAPMHFSSHGFQQLRPPPQLGEHTVEVLRSLGYSTHEINEGLEEVG